MFRSGLGARERRDAGGFSFGALPMSTLKELVSKIAKQEGKKHQASVGDVREIVGIFADVIFQDGEEVFCNDVDSAIIASDLVKKLYQSGERRAKIARGKSKK